MDVFHSTIRGESITEGDQFLHYALYLKYEEAPEAVFIMLAQQKTPLTNHNFVEKVLKFCKKTCERVFFFLIY